MDPWIDLYNVLRSLQEAGARGTVTLASGAALALVDLQPLQDGARGAPSTVLVFDAGVAGDKVYVPITAVTSILVV